MYVEFIHRHCQPFQREQFTCFILARHSNSPGLGIQSCLLALVLIPICPCKIQIKLNISIQSSCRLLAASKCNQAY